MSQLPKIDQLKVQQRINEKLTAELAQAKKISASNESSLELLAEALRDERDEAVAKVAELEKRLNTSVPDITSLPDAQG